MNLMKCEVLRSDTECICIHDDFQPFEVWKAGLGSGQRMSSVMQSSRVFSPTNEDRPLKRLSNRQIEILYWVQEGKSGPDIGVILGISGRTVDKHLENVCAVLGVRRRLQAVLRARDLGLLGSSFPHVGASNMHARLTPRRDAGALCRPSIVPQTLLPLEPEPRARQSNG